MAAAPKALDGTERVSYSVRIDPSLLTTLKHVAVDEKSSVSYIIETAIREFLERRRNKK